MNLWRKLTLDWPRVLGDILWWAFVTAPMASLERLSLRRVALFFAILFLAGLFAQMVSLDFAFILAGDTIFYLEIASAVMLAVARGHVCVTAKVIMRGIEQTIRNTHILVRHRLGTRQRRNLRRRKLAPKSSDDEPTIADWAFA